MPRADAHPTRSVANKFYVLAEGTCSAFVNDTCVKDYEAGSAHIRRERRPQGSSCRALSADCEETCADWSLSLSACRRVRRTRTPLLASTRCDRPCNCALQPLPFASIVSALLHVTQRVLPPLVRSCISSADACSLLLAQAPSALWVMDASYYRAVKQALVQKDLESRVRLSSATPCASIRLSSDACRFSAPPTTLERLPQPLPAYRHRHHHDTSGAPPDLILTF